MEVYVDVAVAVSLTVAIIGCVLGVGTFLRGDRGEVKTDAAKNAEVITKLDFMSNDLKDIKADNRRTKSEINEVRQIAQHAQERADAAHNRLDRAGIDQQHD